MRDQEPASGRPKGSLRRWIIQLAGSALVLGLIFWFLPAGEVWEAMTRVPPGLWLLILACFVLGHVVAAFKWWLLTGSGAAVSFVVALRAHFAGLVTNLCLPGLAGGDVVRAGLVLRGSTDKTRIALGSLADRLLDCFGLLLIAGAGAAFLLGDEAFSVVPLINVGLVFLLVLAAIVAFATVLPRLPLERFSFGNAALARLIGKVAEALRGFEAQPGRLMACLTLSVLVQSGFIVLNVALAGAVGVTASAAAWFFAWPLAKLIAILPVSLAGLGVREASLAALLAPLGGAPAPVVAAGLIWQTILIAGGLVGGLALLLTTRSGAAKAQIWIKS